MSLLMSSNN